MTDTKHSMGTPRAEGPRRSPDPHHQKMTAVELRDAVMTLVGVCEAFGTWWALGSHLRDQRSYGHVQEWAETKMEAVQSELENIVIELESRTGLSDDDTHERDMAIIAALPKTGIGAGFNVTLERIGGAV